MGAETAGRKLGIGLRLAAKAARERAGQAAAVPAPSPTKTQAIPVAAAQATSRAKAIAQGTKRFGEAVWGPMAHTGSVLWLEITGLFFAIFGLFFAQNAYKLRYNWQTGPNHSRFLLYVVITAVFAYFTVSSFMSASRKQKRRRQQGR